MSFDDFEGSAYDGAPQRLFLFSIADLQLAYVQGAKPDNYLGITYEPVPLIEMPDIEQTLSESHAGNTRVGA